MEHEYYTVDDIGADLRKIHGGDKAIARATATLRAARAVREMREIAKLSQAKLAKQLDISQARVSQIESGAASTYGMTVELLERVAEACGGVVEFKFSKSPSTKVAAG
jgi:DNA-binding transcriptional regulator YiaG